MKMLLMKMVRTGSLSLAAQPVFSLLKVMEAEQTKTRSELVHKETAAKYNAAMGRMKQLEKKLKRAINKSKYVLCLERMSVVKAVVGDRQRFWGVFQAGGTGLPLGCCLHGVASQQNWSSQLPSQLLSCQVSSEAPDLTAR